MSEEKTGYHKGALETLLKEKAELSKMLNIVNSLVEKHAQALSDAGVDVEGYIENLKTQKQNSSKSQNRAKVSSEEDSDLSNLLE